MTFHKMQRRGLSQVCATTLRIEPCNRRGPSVGRALRWLLAAIACVPMAVASGSPGSHDLLQRARSNREVLSAAFPGFESQLRIHSAGAVHHGSMVFQPPTGLVVEVADPELRKQAKRIIRSLLSHRMASESSSDETTTSGEADQHPLGRRVLLGDKYDSSYRIRDDRILEVDRQMGDKRLIISVLDTEETASGRYLPTRFFVTVFDSATGAVRRASAYADSYQRIQGDYLPLSRLVISGENGRTETLLIEWVDLQLILPDVHE